MIVFLVLAALACSREGEPPAGRDAGELLKAGVVDVSHLLAPSTFSAVAGAEFYDSATLVVADRIEGITVLKLGGEAEVLGRRGLGPGEYQRVSAVLRHVGSEGLTFHDQRAGRYLTWHPGVAGQGDSGLEASAPAPLPIGATPIWRSGDSIFALQEPLHGTSSDSATLVVLGIQGDARTPLIRVRRLPFARVTASSAGRSVTTFIPLPLAPRDFLAPLPSGDVAVLSVDRQSLIRMSPSATVVAERPIGVAPRPVSEDELAEARRAVEEMAGGAVEVDWPSHHAPFTSLTTSRTGEILIGLSSGVDSTEYLWIDEDLGLRLGFRLESDHRVVAFSPPFVLSTRRHETGLVTLHLSCVLAPG